MSHRDDCPSRYEAERRGELDYENRGYRNYSTPYDGHGFDHGCPEAQRAYLDGNRRAEFRAQEKAAERHSAEAARYQRQQEEQRRDEQQYEQEREDEQLYYERLEFEDAERNVAELHAEF